MQGEVAARGKRARGARADRAAQCVHGDIVRHQHAIEVHVTPNDPANHQRRQGRGSRGIDRRVDDVRGHRPRHVRERAKRREVGNIQFGPSDGHSRQCVVGIHLCATMAGNVLDHRQHTALDQPLAGDFTQSRDLGRVCRIGAVADHGIGARLGHVEHGQAIDGYAERRKIIGDQASHQMHGFARALAAQRGQGRRRGIGAPMRRLQPCHAAALLIDQDGRVRPVHGRAQLAHERAHLIGALAVAPE